jgi:UDP-glucuronate 4-epimerase
MSLSYLVTGAAGFIGFHLSEALLKKGHCVLGVDNLNDYYDTQLKRDRLGCLKKHPQFMFVRLDLSDRVATAALFGGAHLDGVFHFAAQAGVRHSLENPHAYVDSNLVAFINVLEGCRQNEIPHLIFASSSSVYGDNRKLPFDVTDPVDQPASLYAATKRSNELFAYTYSRLYGLQITGLRLFTVYGPWGRPDMAVYKFTRAMLAGEPLVVFNRGQMRRDFTYVDDVVAGIVQAESRLRHVEHGSQSPRLYALYNLGNNRPVELPELISLLEDRLGVKADVRYKGMQPGEVVDTCADIDASVRDLNFEPRTSLRQGIERFVDWYREYHRDTLPAGHAPAIAVARG